MDKEDYVIRLEEEKDYREVENLVREAFWNVYKPGCSEHYLIHVLRKQKGFVKELDFVMIKDGKIIGQNVFFKAKIDLKNGETIPALTMGPISIMPEFKHKGFGKKLLDYSLEKARKLGYGVVVLEGNIKFYGKCGFDYANKFNIKYHGLPEGVDDSFFLCKELTNGYLTRIDEGVYKTPEVYFVEDKDVDEFDKQFVYKKKEVKEGQIFN